MHAGLSDLFRRAAEIITDLRIDRHVLRQLALSEADLVDLGLADGSATASWVELAVRMEQGITDGERDAMLDECQSFHTRVSLRMVGHLTLTAKNIMRTTWLSARRKSSHGTFFRSNFPVCQWVCFILCFD